MSGISPFLPQAAGHSNGDITGKSDLLIQGQGRILKPYQDKSRGESEVHFYELVKSSVNDPLISGFLLFLPEFFGTTSLDERDGQYIVLEDLTCGYAQPCVIDIKIGKQTWSPDAPLEKQLKEQSKYQETRGELGFCIPGMYIYNLKTRKVDHYTKDYGKLLTKDNICDALHLFLNEPSVGIKRLLVMEILSQLWHLLHLFKMQTHFHFYSSSVLIVYDACWLQGIDSQDDIRLQKHSNCLNEKSNASKLKSSAAGVGGRKPSIVDLDFFHLIAGKPKSGKRCANSIPKFNRRQSSSRLFAVLCRSHSAEHDYDRELDKARDSYSKLLGGLTSNDHRNAVNDVAGGCVVGCNSMPRSKKDPPVTVKMIDFAHVYPGQMSIDANYIFGLENLIRAFEELLFGSK